VARRDARAFTAVCRRNHFFVTAALLYAPATRRMGVAVTRTTARGWWASLAAVVLVAFVIQLWVAVEVPGTPRAHAVGTLAGAPLASRVVRVLSFFTVQSNILSGVTCAVLALAPDRDGSRWRPVRLASLFGITVTGIVYATVLARIHEPHGWRETVANTGFHYIVPIMMVLGWLMLGPRPRIDIRTVGLALLWPVAWITYTLIHGAFSSWYPYPFVDVITHGYARVLLNGALVVVVLAIVTALFWVGDRRLPTTPIPRHSSAPTP